MHSHAEEFCKRARQLRECALAVAEPDKRKQVLELADQYDRLAQSAGQRERANVRAEAELGCR